MIYRRKPENLRDRRPVLDAMGRCRNAILAAQDQVKPFGPTFKVLQLVTKAIDEAATYLTGGNETFYHASGSSPSAELDKWRDTGSGR